MTLDPWFGFSEDRVRVLSEGGRSSLSEEARWKAGGGEPGVWAAASMPGTKASDSVAVETLWEEVPTGGLTEGARGAIWTFWSL